MVKTILIYIFLLTIASAEAVTGSDTPVFEDLSPEMRLSKSFITSEFMVNGKKFICAHDASSGLDWLFPKKISKKDKASIAPSGEGRNIYDHISVLHKNKICGELNALWRLPNLLEVYSLKGRLQLTGISSDAELAVWTGDILQKTEMEVGLWI